MNLNEASRRKEKIHETVKSLFLNRRARQTESGFTGNEETTLVIVDPSSPPDLSPQEN